ncbi:hypothetical protein NMY22_g10564 [Coprinellus aureogranulatus]|nr:hypothetical protein NMY22_g10564 [Coprinellus aureogranulatus]
MPIFSRKDAPGSAPAPLQDKGKGPALIQRHPRSTATAGPSRSTASRNVPPSPVASPEDEPCLAVATRATGSGRSLLPYHSLPEPDMAFHLVSTSRRGRAQPLFHDTMNGLVEAGTRLQRAAGTRGVNMFNFQTSINVNEDTVRAGLNDVATITQTLGNLAYPKEAAGLGDDRDPVDGTWRDFIPGRASFASGSRWSFRFFFRLLRLALFVLIIPLTMLLTFAIYNRAVMPNLQGQAREATAGMNDFNRQMNEFFCTFPGSGWILGCEDQSSANGTVTPGTQLAHPLVDEVKEAFEVQTGTFSRTTYNDHSFPASGNGGGSTTRSHRHIQQGIQKAARRDKRGDPQNFETRREGLERQLDKIWAKRGGKFKTQTPETDAAANSTLFKYLPGLWEKLASNREDMRLYHENLQALKNLRIYESETQTRVLAARASVWSAKNDVKRMESRVSPQQVKDFTALRIEIHLEGLRSSWHRLGSIHKGEGAPPRTVDGAS